MNTIKVYKNKRKVFIYNSKGLPLGTVHTWSDGSQHKKTGEGWIAVTRGKGDQKEKENPKEKGKRGFTPKSIATSVINYFNNPPEADIGLGEFIGIRVDGKNYNLYDTPDKSDDMKDPNAKKYEKLGGTSVIKVEEKNLNEIEELINMYSQYKENPYVYILRYDIGNEGDDDYEQVANNPTIVKKIKIGDEEFEEKIIKPKKEKIKKESKKERIVEGIRYKIGDNTNLGKIKEFNEDKVVLEPRKEEGELFPRYLPVSYLKKKNKEAEYV